MRISCVIFSAYAQKILALSLDALASSEYDEDMLKPISILTEREPGDFVVAIEEVRLATAGKRWRLFQIGKHRLHKQSN